ncbi:PH domain-containing protein [Heyndrickxia sporothermodurans]
MMEAKRYHPLNLLYDLWNLVKNSFFIVLFLFIIKYGSKSAFIKYGRIAFLLFFAIGIVYIILRWFTHKYKLDDTSFHIYKGIFTKSKQTIPFSKVQNVNRRTSLFHRMFKVTSIRFETGMSGDDAAIDFEVISRGEADSLEKYVKSPVRNEIESDEIVHEGGFSEDVQAERIIHFRPTTKDTLKASFTSFSFLLLIPIILSIYSKIDDIFHVEDEAKGVFSFIMNSWWVISTIVILLLIASIAFGVIRTFVKYGKYEISSDEESIYITKGVIDETAFSIAKNKVQAVEITQSVMKRILGLAEVKLISVGNTSSEEDKIETNSLYPFLPVGRAYEMLSEILPAYEITNEMTRLPKVSFWVRLFRPSWIWIIATVALFYFKPDILGITQAWWMISVILLIWIGTGRILNFSNTRYTINQQFVQFKSGSLTTSLFVSKREKIIEVNVTRSFYQKWLGLATIETVNRAKPVHHVEMQDVPKELAATFYKWYLGRREEIKVE